MTVNSIEVGQLDSGNFLLSFVAHLDFIAYVAQLEFTTNNDLDVFVSQVKYLGFIKEVIS